jgi:acyl-CoA hydrolase
MRMVTEREVLDGLAALEAPAPRVVVSGNFATPWELVRLLDAGLPRCRAFVLNPQAGWPRRDGFVTETPFVGPGVRDDPRLDYLPMRLSLVPRLFDTLRPPDAALVHTSPPRGGKVSLGIEVNYLPAAIERVRSRGGLVVAQVNPRMPYTVGDGELDAGLIDLGLEVEGALPSPVGRPPDPAAAAIGARVAAWAVDGATLQLGIGQLPDAAARELRSVRRLGVWSELVSDGVLALEQAGALDPDRPLCTTFLFGSPELYEWADRNPRLTVRRTEVVNDPARIAAQPAMLSVNTALQVDLFAQSNTSYAGGRIWSGFGGQPDFVSGALHADGGHAVIALRSWHDKTDTSSVVPLLREPASSFQHSVVVTEHGSAELFGHSQHDQAALLIERAADPRARDALWDAAGTLGLVRADDGL